MIEKRKQLNRGMYYGNFCAMVTLFSRMLRSYNENTFKHILMSPPSMMPVPSTACPLADRSPICHFCLIRELLSTTCLIVQGLARSQLMTKETTNIFLIQCRKPTRFENYQSPYELWNLHLLIAEFALTYCRTCTDGLWNLHWLIPSTKKTNMTVGNLMPWNHRRTRWWQDFSHTPSRKSVPPIWNYKTPGKFERRPWNISSSVEQRFDGIHTFGCCCPSANDCRHGSSITLSMH